MTIKLYNLIQMDAYPADSCAISPSALLLYKKKLKIVMMTQVMNGSTKQLIDRSISVVQWVDNYRQDLNMVCIDVATHQATAPTS